jgi:hypothetical protein
LAPRNSEYRRHSKSILPYRIVQEKKSAKKCKRPLHESFVVGSFGCADVDLQAEGFGSSILNLDAVDTSLSKNLRGPFTFSWGKITNLQEFEVRFNTRIGFGSRTKYFSLPKLDVYTGPDIILGNVQFNRDFMHPFKTTLQLNIKGLAVVMGGRSPIQ